jgi:hypothetical protein
MATNPISMATMKMPSRLSLGSAAASERPWCRVRHHSTAKWLIGMTSVARIAATAERRDRTSGSPGTRRRAR